MSKKDQPVTAYKGFNHDLTCRGFQYAEGQTYEHEGHVAACSSGFHACEMPIDVLRYYAPASSTYRIVQLEGDLSRDGDDSKVAARKLTVGAEIGIPGLVKAQIEYVTSRAKAPVKGGHSTGNSGAASATGNSGAASATGYSGAASATGWYGSAKVEGPHSVAVAAGGLGKASGAEGCVLVLIERDTRDGHIIGHASVMVGQDGIDPGVWYALRGGKVVKA